MSESFDFRVERESETAESKAQRKVVGSLHRFGCFLNAQKKMEFKRKPNNWWQEKPASNGEFPRVQVNNYFIFSKI